MSDSCALNSLFATSMVDAGILSNKMKYPYPAGYMIFLNMTICSDTLIWSDNTLTCDLVTNLDLFNESDFFFQQITRGFHRKHLQQV